MTNEAENVQKDEKSTSKTRDRSGRSKPKLLNKVIVRRLPPTMTEEEFFQQIEPMPECESCYYCMADWSLGQDATCRAYLNFKNQDDIFLFKDRFDGYVFVDSKGVEYPALVEYAPFQGLPKNRSRKNDHKANTIETDPHYINFLEKLKNEENEKSEMKLEFNLQSNKENKVTSTPLLEYVANKMQEKRDEKKRKQDERKQRREDVRQKKKILIAQKVPPAIKEEESKSKDTKENKEKEKLTEKRDNFSNRNDDRKDKIDKTEARDRNDRGSRNSRNERSEREKLDRERRNEERREKEKKRRQERDEKRRQEREKRDQERKEKKLDGDKKGNDSTTDTKKDTESKRIEIKKYSESRKDKMRSREDSKVQKIEENIKSREEPIRGDSMGSDKTSTTSTSLSGELNENVKDFIMSAAMMKDINVKSNQIFAQETETNDIQPVSENDQKTNKSLKEVNEKLEKMSISQPDYKRRISVETSDSERISQDCDPMHTSRRGSRSSSGTNEKYEKYSREDRELRRIRNKDRPSIEIYQPGRLKLNRSGTDGRSSVEPKESKSNPTSDGENSKKIEKEERKNNEAAVVRKVSRYSERTRSGRVREKSEKSESDKEERRKSVDDIKIAQESIPKDFLDISQLAENLTLENKVNLNENKIETENNDEKITELKEETDKETKIESAKSVEELIELENVTEEEIKPTTEKITEEKIDSIEETPVVEIESEKMPVVEIESEKTPVVEIESEKTPTVEIVPEQSVPEKIDSEKVEMDIN